MVIIVDSFNVNPLNELRLIQQNTRSVGRSFVHSTKSMWMMCVSYAHCGRQVISDSQERSTIQNSRSSRLGRQKSTIFGNYPRYYTIKLYKSNHENQLKCAFLEWSFGQCVLSMCILYKSILPRAYYYSNGNYVILWTA